jgi:hypothetical protein
MAGIGDKPISRVAQEGQRIFALERPLLFETLNQGEHYRRARQRNLVGASSVEHGHHPAA